MRLSRRIRDLLRASVGATLRYPAGWRPARSPTKLDAQLERIRTSLTRGIAREKHVQDELAMAEQEGRERDVIRLQRDLSELNQSMDELRGALDLIQARIEMAHQAESSQAVTAAAAGEAARPGTSSHVLLSTATDGGEEPRSASQDDDLEDRKQRLSKPG
jgi:hypothetical protein